MGEAVRVPLKPLFVLAAFGIVFAVFVGHLLHRPTNKLGHLIQWHIETKRPEIKWLGKLGFVCFLEINGRTYLLSLYQLYPVFQEDQESFFTEELDRILTDLTPEYIKPLLPERS